MPRTFLALLLVAHSALALDPHRNLTQYSRTLWTQQDGLPQDTIRAVAQTHDGYLWLGTDEGLARFDGYEFVVFTKANSALPANSITSLAAAHDGSLWIGTSNGLAQYRNKEFYPYTVKQGLPDNAINQVLEDRSGAVWIVAGVYLSRWQNGQFTNFSPGRDMPLTSARTMREDGARHLWVAGFSGVARLDGGKFEIAVSQSDLQDNIPTSLLFDRNGALWIGGNKGLIERSPAGDIRRYDAAGGLPDPFVRALIEDRDGNVWVGTNAGVARLEGGRFVTFPEVDGRSREMVRCMFEDRESNLWVGSNNGLERFREDVFTVYGKTEGWPSDEPNAVFQDRSGRVWVGFHDAGLMRIEGQERRLFTTRDGLPNNEIFSIRQTPGGDLLIGARGGVVRIHGDSFSTFVVPDPLARLNVFDALEDGDGRVWLATPGGLVQLRGREHRIVLPGGPLIQAAFITLCEGRDGAIWAGTYGRGLWRIKDGEAPRQFTAENGLSSDQIRTLYEDAEGTLWISTFGGGLDSLRDGKFHRYTADDGLLSDNISKVTDDGESLWLATTRGISQVAKRQLREFAEGKLRSLDPVNYGIEDGLRSAQCSPSYPTGAGGVRTADGRVWFTTGRGLAVFDPRLRTRAPLAPVVQLVEATAAGRPLDLAHDASLDPGSERMQFRYTAIHLSAPEQVQYAYRLDGLDTDWVRAGSRRLINYNSLKHGSYRFHVRAELPGGPASEQSYAFQVLPQFYETAWFRVLFAAALALGAWMVYQVRLRQIRSRFAAVLEERARLAREIHDTLAQGFVGISSQLDAVAMSMPDEGSPARRYLEMARKMARHSLTEARRSVMDLRASALEGQDLAAALQSGARAWTAGSGVDVDVAVTGPHGALPEEMEQHLLRIAQEAVTNVLKHAGASKLWIKLHSEARSLYLRVVDNGRGFEERDAFSAAGGHFGLLGMRERAQRLGGELRLASHPGEGTEVEVTVPLP
ncbi:MAG TPA: two-component regulator propeller domain-containing protein [Bryobacteraceae bacterium]